MSVINLTYDVPGDDFTRAVEASGNVKKQLRRLGYNSDAIRRIAIANSIRSAASQAES